jgi:hypothetical protein
MSNRKLFAQRLPPKVWLAISIFCMGSGLALLAGVAIAVWHSP